MASPCPSPSSSPSSSYSSSASYASADADENVFERAERLKARGNDLFKRDQLANAVQGWPQTITKSLCVST